MKFKVSEQLPNNLMDPIKQGRPSLYDPKMCEIVIEIAKEGGFRAAMCVGLGITERTFNKYIKDFPEFANAVEFAELILLAQQEELLQLGAQGKIKNYDFRANSYILNNKYKQLYDKSGGNNTEVTINTINLTPEQIQNKIAQKLEKLKSLGIETDGSIDQSQPPQLTGVIESE